MPLTPKGQEIMAAMTKEYGTKRGKSVFYASANSGRITGVHKGRKRRAAPRRRSSVGASP